MIDCARPFVFIAATLLAVAISSCGSIAADSGVVEERAVQAWGETHPECAEWSDACVVCRRGTGDIACSLPGIACQPGPTVCRNPAPAPGTKP